MPDGRVIYGDAPAPGAVKVEKTKPDTSKKGITAATPKETEALRKLESERPSERRGRPARGRDRGGAAQDGSRAREGKEPLEGERIGTVGGGGRFTDSYWERQKKYEAGMESLRNELERARLE